VACKTVFVVEDDPTLCDVLREELQEAGWAAVGFTTPSAALAEIETNPPDVVLVDYGLPEMMGDDFLRAVRDRLPEVSLVLMSGDPRAVRLDAPAAWRLLTKPFPIERVLSALDSAIARPV
jgi:DNA-binding response OmpR family regulator